LKISIIILISGEIIIPIFKRNNLELDDYSTSNNKYSLVKLIL